MEPATGGPRIAAYTTLSYGELPIKLYIWQSYANSVDTSFGLKSIAASEVYYQYDQFSMQKISGKFDYGVISLYSYPDSAKHRMVVGSDSLFFTKTKKWEDNPDIVSYTFERTAFTAPLAIRGENGILCNAEMRIAGQEAKLRAFADSPETAINTIPFIPNDLSTPEVREDIAKRNARKNALNPAPNFFAKLDGPQYVGMTHLTFDQITIKLYVGKSFLSLPHDQRNPAAQQARGFLEWFFGEGDLNKKYETGILFLSSHVDEDKNRKITADLLLYRKTANWKDNPMVDSYRFDWGVDFGAEPERIPRERGVLCNAELRVAGLEAERRAGEPDLRSYALKIGPQILRDLLRKETALLIKSRV